MRIRRATLLILVTSMVVAIACSFQLMRAATVLSSFAVKTEQPIASLYLKCFGFESAFRDLTISGSSAPISVRIYSPEGIQNPPTIILVHGFAPEGFRHPVLNTLARRLARTGLRVVIPTIEGESKFEMTSSDLRLIEDTIHWSATTFGQPVSVLGISFGGALAINAAAQPAVAKDVKLIVCISGYNSLDSVGHFYIHDTLYGPDGKPYQGSGPPTGPLLFTSQYLSEMVPEADVAAFRKPLNVFKSHATDHIPPQVAESIEAFTPEERELFFDLQSVKKPAIRTRYLAILQRHREEIAALSPSTVLPGLRIPLYVMHGSHDPAIPVEEVAWMKKESTSNPNAHFLISSWLKHADLGQPSGLFEKTKAIIFFAEILHAAHTT